MSYTSSSIGMIISSYSQLQFDGIKIINITSQMDLISLRLDTLISFTNSEINSWSAGKNKVIEGISITLILMKNIRFINLSSNSFHIHSSKLSNIDSILMQNCLSWIEFHNSQINLITNSTFDTWGQSSTIMGGAIYSSYSNLTVNNSIFKNNSAIEGGAIYFEWSISNQWSNTVSNCNFTNNKGNKGGSILYNANRPKMFGNVFINNTASYGPNVGSYPISIVGKPSNSRATNIYNIGSGIPYHNELTFSLIDYDNQVCVLESNSIIKIVSESSDWKIQGIDYAKLTKGVAVFQSVTFVGRPGLTNAKFKLQWDAIDNQIINEILLSNQSDSQMYSSYISATFRYWMPGEIQNNNEWLKWSYLTYSLNWNSTQCNSCVNNAIWAGEANITVNEGYWRYTTNSSTIIKCPRERSCLGGYYPQNQYPVQWADGYSGYLWRECQIINGTKYQPESNYEWLKCPDSTLNIIRIIGFVILALLFISAILFVNIRKKNENQFSILMRIFTNYIQLISVSLTFNISLPNVFNDVFSQTNRVGTPNESFFSFDCFIEDTELKGFAPSASLFKLFLYSLLPLALFLFYFIIFMIIKLVLNILNKGANLDIKRYMGVTVVWIIFIFHPSMILQSLNSFSCQQIDSGVYKMKEWMQYDWYSKEHLFWASITGLPMLIIWVIGMPLIALFILIKKRNSLDDWSIKKYLLILYQGLKPKVFYWEFINTFRKVVILLINVVLVSYSSSYRVLIAICFLVIILKVQERLKPYKNEENNRIEMIAIIAAFITFYWAIIFVSQDSSPPGFNEFAVFLMFFINVYFIVHWTFLLLCSIGWNNEKYQLFLSIYSLLICKKKAFLADQAITKKSSEQSKDEVPTKIKKSSVINFTFWIKINIYRILKSIKSLRKVSIVAYEII